MWDWSGYKLKDLFKIRDALMVLQGYKLENEDMLASLVAEINERED